MVNAIDSFLLLKNYCEQEQFKGWDVSDGIESPILCKTFLGKSAFCRFVFQQLT